MNVQTFVLGPLENNAYVVEGEGQRSVIIDAPMGPDELIAYLKKKKLVPEAVLITHSHFDHINGLAEIKKEWPLPVYVHKEEFGFLADPALNGTVLFGYGPGNNVPADKSFTDNEVLLFAGLEIRAIHTPGHSPGGSCFFVGDFLFSGDTLFRLSVGRTDIPGGNTKVLLKSIREKLFTLPDEVLVLPGHMGSSKIGFEKKRNPFAD
jgi:glyoxylase-like metal-dependent hydrolase (beta-lactamase superfamily II)